MLADIRADARRAATLAAEVMLGNYRRQVREALTVADPRRRVLLERIASAVTAHPWPVGEDCEKGRGAFPMTVWTVSPNRAGGAS